MGYFEYYKELLSDKDFAKFEETLKTPFRKSLRVNTIKTSVKEFEEIAKTQNWKIENTPWTKEGFFIDREPNSVPLGKTIFHHSGLFYIQEASSMLPVELFSEITNEDLILDLASAPGSKFTQIAAKSCNLAFIIANETSGMRIKGLVSNIKRMGITNSIVVQKDPETLARLFPNTFSKIMLDAPCSGDGMYRRDMSLISKWSINKIKFQAGIQKRLIEEAFLLLKPGGELIYSTCTLSKEEDEEVINYLLTKYKSSKLVPIKNKPLKENIGTLRIWPFDYNTEGFFVAKLTKTEETASIHNNITFNKNQRGWDYITKSKLKIIKDFFESNFEYEFELKNNETIIEKNGEAWIWPEKCISLIHKINPVFSGIKIGKFIYQDFIPSHSFCMKYGNLFKSNLIDIEENNVSNYLKGQDLDIKTKNVFYCVKSENIVLGLTKSDGTYLKNKLPRDLTIK